jgi:alpha-tubulin suppressor-like RCC1 family protein
MPQVQQIQCGYDHCIAFVAEDGGLGAPPVEKIFTWGRGEEGQLGHEDKYSRCAALPAARRLALLPPLSASDPLCLFPAGLGPFARCDDAGLW